MNHHKTVFTMKVISTQQAPAAIGPYSQAIHIGNLVYTSGQLPIDPATGAFPVGGIKEQTRQSLTNVQAILREAGVRILLRALSRPFCRRRQDPPQIRVGGNRSRGSAVVSFQHQTMLLVREEHGLTAFLTSEKRHKDLTL